MLAALIAFQNEARPAPRPSTIKIELRGGGGPRIPMYDVVDYIAVLASFPDVSGEHPIAKAKRREQWMAERLPLVKDIRERREAAAFLAGAQLATATAEEQRIAAEHERLCALVLSISADLDAEAARATARDRSTRHNPIGPLLVFGGTVALVAAFVKRR